MPEKACANASNGDRKTLQAHRHVFFHGFPGFCLCINFGHGTGNAHKRRRGNGDNSSWLISSDEDNRDEHEDEEEEDGDEMDELAFIDEEIPSEEDQDDPSLAVFVGKRFAHGKRRRSSSSSSKTNKASSKSASSSASAAASSSAATHENKVCADNEQHKQQKPKHNLRYACRHFARASATEAELAGPCEKCISKGPVDMPKRTVSLLKTFFLEEEFRNSSSGGGNNNKKPDEEFDTGMDRRLRDILYFAKSHVSGDTKRVQMLEKKLEDKNKQITRLLNDFDQTKSSLLKRAQEAEGKASKFELACIRKVMFS